MIKIHSISVTETLVSYHTYSHSSGIPPYAVIIVYNIVIHTDGNPDYYQVDQQMAVCKYVDRLIAV